MIRYVYIGDQIDEGEDEFAFFDTISERFIDFGGVQVFYGIADFEFYASTFEQYERCLALIPMEKACV